MYIKIKGYIYTTQKVSKPYIFGAYIYRNRLGLWAQFRAQNHIFGPFGLGPIAVDSCTDLY